MYRGIMVASFSCEKLIAYGWQGIYLLIAPCLFMLSYQMQLE